MALPWMAILFELQKTDRRDAARADMRDTRSTTDLGGAKPVGVEQRRARPKGPICRQN